MSRAVGFVVLIAGLVLLFIATMWLVYAIRAPTKTYSFDNARHMNVYAIAVAIWAAALTATAIGAVLLRRGRP